MTSHLSDRPVSSLRTRMIEDMTVRGFNSPARDREFADSPLEGAGFELVWGFSCQVVIFGL
jgi:hypothetical protein